MARNISCNNILLPVLVYTIIEGLACMVLKMKFKTHQGVLQLCVSVSETAPSLWNILRTARLVPIECPDSTLIKLAIRFSAWASIRPETELKIMS